MAQPFTPPSAMDKLSALLASFSLQTGVFYTGNICGVHDFERDTRRGHMHLVKRGPVQVLGLEPQQFLIERPTLLFLPRPERHRLVADERAGADVVCATVEFGGGGVNPITSSLPSVVQVELAAMPGVEALLELMFDEAFADHNGKQAVLDRLCEVLIIRLLRHSMDMGLACGGTLAAIADPRLSKAVLLMHERPATPWSLEDLATEAGMSRARFAVRFREVTGDTPADYLASWRLLLAQRLLKRGLPLKVVALDVGYGSASALNRVFVRKLGAAPMQWLRVQQVESQNGL